MSAREGLNAGVVFAMKGPTGASLESGSDSPSYKGVAGWDHRVERAMSWSAENALPRQSLHSLISGLVSEITRSGQA